MGEAELSALYVYELIECSQYPYGISHDNFLILQLKWLSYRAVKSLGKVSQLVSRERRRRCDLRERQEAIAPGCGVYKQNLPI